MAGAERGWSTVATADAPGPAENQVAVWTGSEMIIWGGARGTEVLAGGARYDPVRDRWSPMTTNGAPSPRAGAAAVWSGAELLVWGGLTSFQPTSVAGDGARYDPVTDSWASLSSIGAPMARGSPGAVWSGREMVVWGGFDRAAAALADGGRYDPTSDTWTSVSATGAPAARLFHSATWTGSEVIVWGGGASSLTSAYGDGGRYDPLADSWRSLPSSGGPSGRFYHSAVWSGSELIIWGGASASFHADGARYSPTLDTWTPIQPDGVMAARAAHSAVWTGTEMLVFGGGTLATAAFAESGIYDPIGAAAWTPLDAAGAPPARRLHSAVWTGAEMIVWGGLDAAGYVSGGGRFRP